MTRNPPPPARRIAPGVTVLTAPNPGPMTGAGTNSYVLGGRDVAIVDPGPDSADHLRALLALVPRDGAVSHILVTHAHLDHTAGVAALQAATGAPVHAFGPATAGRSAFMARLATRAGLAGGEGIDTGFAPDQILPDGARIGGDDWAVQAVHTPGHLSNHLCLAVEGTDMVLTGDHMMGWSSTLISPPDGSLADFMASAEKLLDRREARYLPGHGDPVADGKALVARQIAHRRTRSGQIVQALGRGPATVAELTAQIYADVPAHLHRAAARNVLAHLIDFAETGQMALPAGRLDQARFTLGTGE